MKTWQKEVGFPKKYPNISIYPEWDCGMPRCNDRCPQHDGKRCELLGCRPSSICEIAVKEMAIYLDRLHKDKTC
jgi:hypothetical protein